MRPGATLGLALTLFAQAAAATPVGPVDRPARPQIESRYTPELRACPGLQNSTQEMVDCFVAEAGRQDVRLNALYRSALKDLSEPQKQRLRASERAWIAYRDAWCAAQRDDEAWGTLSRVVQAQCVVDETILRIIALEAFPPAT